MNNLERKIEQLQDEVCDLKVEVKALLSLRVENERLMSRAHELEQKLEGIEAKHAAIMRREYRRNNGLQQNYSNAMRANIALRNQLQEQK